MNVRSCFVHCTQRALLIFATTFLLACVAATTVQASPGPSESIKFTLSPRGHLLVPVSINGSEPLIFVLDTGAGKSLVTPLLLERLALATVDGESASTLGMHGMTKNAFVDIRSVAVGKVRVLDIRAIVLDLEYMTERKWHVDGVLGMDFLTQFDVRLELGANTVSFYPKAPDRDNCIACPAGIDGIEFDTVDPGFIVLPATVDSKPVNAVLDTGSGHSGLNVRAAAALGVAIPPMPDEALGGHSIGLETGPVRIGEKTLTERAAVHVMDHPIMEELGLAKQPAMLMGTDQLMGRTVTISYGLKMLFIE
jgi:predicted aspartyl protease